MTVERHSQTTTLSSFEKELLDLSQQNTHSKYFIIILFNLLMMSFTVAGHWHRPECPTITPATDNFSKNNAQDKQFLISYCHLGFMQIEIDNYNGIPHEKLKNVPTTVSAVPIMRLYGVTQDQNTVLCHVHGLFAYLYVKAPETYSPDIHNNFVTALAVSFFPFLNHD